MSYILARLREASTYAGLAAIIAALGIPHASEISALMPQIGVVIMGALAIAIPDNGAAS